MANFWQPPRLRTLEDSKERRATWLELFYDLVFVAAIAELAHNLSEDVSLLGFLGFAALFIPVWWCWVGATFYATRFDTDDLGYRLLTLLQMAIVAALAINVHHGLDSSSTGFALSFVAFRSILVLQYLVAGYYIPRARPLTTWYATGFGTGAALWLLSIFVPIPWRFGLWALGLLIDFATPQVRGQLVTQVPPSVSHIPERLGLFTIIVLGEAVIGVVRGVADQEWSLSSVLMALLGLSIAFSLWWIYFDSVDGSPIRQMRGGQVYIGLIWLYAHLPLAIGLAATGVGVEHAVLSSENSEWLLYSAVALCLTALALIHLITCTLGTTRQRKILSAYRLGAAMFALVLAVAGTALAPVVSVALIAITCAIQVALGPLGRLQTQE